MEDTLGVNLIIKQCYFDEVLILVLMEDTLGVMSLAWQFVRKNGS